MSDSKKRSRREFIKSGGAAAAGALVAGCDPGGLQNPQAIALPSRAHGGSRPNILFMLVDEQRYPPVYEAGID